MKKMAHIVAVLVIAFSVLFWGSSVSAHSTGASFEKTVDNYLIDVGYSEVSIQEGTPVRFDFDLFDAQEQTTPKEFSDAWIRISQGNKTFFAGQLGRPQLGKTGITLVIPEAGEYELYVRYNNDNESVVETIFPLQVEVNPETETQQQRKRIIIAFGGVILVLLSFLSGFVISDLLTKRQHARTSKK